jgi:oxaloacetate decarboxylase gamma subunit
MSLDMESLQEALGLLIIGMITVFIVLWLVTVIGNSVIRLSNRFLPETKTKDTPRTGGVDKGKMAAIVAAVDVATGGKGVIDSIEKR